MRHIIIHFILSVIGTIVTSQKCPPGCYCTGRFATCSGFVTFPQSFETSAEIISIHRSSLSEIPKNALSGAPNISEVYIYESVIGKIQTCAFNGLTNLTSVAIYNSNIGTIASGAFSNIAFTDSGNSRFSIYQVNIDTIEPYAFMGISNPKVFNIYQANITTIESHAFSDLSKMPFFSIYLSNISNMKSSAFHSFSEIGYVSVYSSFIESLDCGTFERFTLELGNRFSFYELEVNCDCNIAMLLIAAKRNPAISVGRTRCRGPPQVAGTPLSALSIPQICKVGTQRPNCPIPKPALPAVCSDRGTVKNRVTDVNNSKNAAGEEGTGDSRTPIAGKGANDVSGSVVNAVDKNVSRSTNTTTERNVVNVDGEVENTTMNDTETVSSVNADNQNDKNSRLLPRVTGDTRNNSGTVREIIGTSNERMQNEGHKNRTEGHRVDTETTEETNAVDETNGSEISVSGNKTQTEDSNLKSEPEESVEDDIEGNVRNNVTDVTDTDVTVKESDQNPTGISKIGKNQIAATLVTETTTSRAVNDSSVANTTMGDTGDGNDTVTEVTADDNDVTENVNGVVNINGSNTDIGGSIGNSSNIVNDGNLELSEEQIIRQSNSSVIIAIFSKRYDVMSLIIAFFNFLFK